MNRLRFITFCVFVTTASVGAQVHELWRTGFTNGSAFGPPWTNYVIPTNFVTTAAAVDAEGNTLVGGAAQGRMAGTPPGQAFVAKVSPTGELLWVYRTGDRAFNGVESLALGPSGQAILVTRLTTDEPRPTALVAVAPDGQELWRAEETNAVGNSVPVNSVGVDQSGNVFWYGLRWASVAPEARIGEVFLTKFNSTGQKLWRLTLPPEQVLIPAGGLGKALCLMPDGGAAVTGGYTSEQGVHGGFVAKISSTGELLWFAKPMMGTNQPIVPSSTVKAGTNGTIWAVGPYRYTILATNGEMFRFGTEYLGVSSATASSDGGFLLDQLSGTHYLRLDAEGQIRWRTTVKLHGSLGGVEDEMGGFLVASGNYGWPAASLVLDYIDPEGNMLWSFLVQNSHYDGWSSETSPGSLLRAPDGTYRVVLNESGGSGYDIGVAVMAFGLDNSPRQPRIVAPPEPASWDGTNDVRFSVTAEGADPLRYQWFSMQYPIPDATNSTLTIPAASLPAYRGFFYVQVDDTNGYVLSRAVNLHCGRIWLNVPTPADLGGLTVSVFGDIEVSFQIERSTDLINWEPVPGAVESSSYAISADIPSQGGAFYRAVVLPLGSTSSGVPGSALRRKGSTASQR